MNHPTRQFPSVLHALAPAKRAFDPFKVQAPDVGDRNICGITSAIGRSVLFAPEGDLVPGGNEQPAPVVFSPEQQTHLEKILKERLDKQKNQYEGKLKEFGEFKTKYEEAERARSEESAKAAQLAEETRLSKLSVDEQLKEKLKAHSQELKTRDEKHATELTGAKAEAQRISDSFTSYVKRGMALAAILPGAVEGSGDYAVDAFMRDAEVELDENREFVSVAVKGRTFESMADAAKHWLNDVAPMFAKAPPGGSGGRRGIGTGPLGRTALKDLTPEQAFKAARER